MKTITDWKSCGKKIADHARKGAAMGVDCGKMCGDCAFKPQDKDTNGYADAVDDAVSIILMGGRFNCHDHDNNGQYVDAGKPCAGMAYAKLYLDSIDNEID